MTKPYISLAHTQCRENFAFRILSLSVNTLFHAHFLDCYDFNFSLRVFCDFLFVDFVVVVAAAFNIFIVVRKEGTPKYFKDFNIALL